MTNDEIIKMAKQAGGRFSRNPDKYDVMEITYCGLEAFAKMVAEKEREECAKRLEAVGCQHCAENIRQKGQE